MIVDDEDEEELPSQRSVMLGLEVGLRQHVTLLFKNLVSSSLSKDDDGLVRFEAGLRNALLIHEQASACAMRVLNYEK